MTWVVLRSSLLLCSVASQELGAQQFTLSRVLGKLVFPVRLVVPEFRYAHFPESSRPVPEIRYALYTLLPPLTYRAMTSCVAKMASAHDSDFQLTV